MCHVKSTIKVGEPGIGKNSWERWAKVTIREIHVYFWNRSYLGEIMEILHYVKRLNVKDFNDLCDLVVF